MKGLLLLPPPAFATYLLLLLQIFPWVPKEPWTAGHDISVAVGPKVRPVAGCAQHSSGAWAAAAGTSADWTAALYARCLHPRAPVPCCRAWWWAAASATT